jgi:hypothetical protein
MTIASDALRDMCHDPGMRTSAVFGTATIYGHFKNMTIVVEGIETRAPTYKSTDTELAGAAHGGAITIEGTNYYIRGIQPNGKGSTLLILRKS